MPRTKKLVAFDLSTEALKKYYPSKSWENAYDVIKRHMLKNGFEWLQGSVYASKRPMSPYQTAEVLKNLVAKHPWLNVCMKDCRQANLSGKQQDLNYVFDKNADVKPREQQAEKGDGKSPDEYNKDIEQLKQEDKNNRSAESAEHSKDTQDKPDKSDKKDKPDMSDR